MYKHIALGGTFDHLHTGHKKIIRVASQQAERVTIGLTMPLLYKKKLLAETIEKYTVRKQRLKVYLSTQKVLDKVTIIPLHDIYGPTLTDQSIDAIVVTNETIGNAKLINSKREEKGLKPLKAILVPFASGDDGAIITSERIRLGEIDSNGYSYKKNFLRKPSYQLPNSLREKMREPIDLAFTSISDMQKLLSNNLIITVGDIISTTLQGAGCNVAIRIIDYKTRRNIIDHVSTRLRYQFENPPGSISRKFAGKFGQAIQLYFSTKLTQTISVNGEEDLLALPAILLAPLNSLVLYGQFGLGIVAVRVNEKTKKVAEILLQQFD